MPEVLTKESKPIQKTQVAPNYTQQDNSTTSKVEAPGADKSKVNQGVSGLSLSSVSLKKRIQNKEQTGQKERILPENPFTEADVVTQWKAYTKAKMDEGEQNIAAVLAMDTPKLTANQTLVFKVANEINKVELTHEMATLLPYLKGKLKNHKIQLDIHISKTVVQETAYTPMEKYKLLVKINPELENLRKTFDLEF